MRSIHAYFIEQVELKEAAKANVSQTKDFDEDFERIRAINDAWNKEIAEAREIRLAEMDANRREEILQKLVDAEERRAKKKQTVEALVRKEKVRVTLISD